MYNSLLKKINSLNEEMIINNEFKTLLEEIDNSACTKDEKLTLKDKLLEKNEKVVMRIHTDFNELAKCLKEEGLW